MRSHPALRLSLRSEGLQAASIAPVAYAPGVQVARNCVDELRVVGRIRDEDPAGGKRPRRLEVDDVVGDLGNLLGGNTGPRQVGGLDIDIG